MISASMVKELRETSGAGMLDCKKALEATNGNMDEAINWLREKGISKAAKKASRIAAEGLAYAKIDGNKAVIIEVNSETDFVAKNDEFKALVTIANIDYFVRDINNLVVFQSLYDNQIDIDELFTNAESAVEKIQIYNASVKDSKDMYDYGHIYIDSVTDIMNTKYISKLSYSIIHGTGAEFDNAASKIKLFNQYSEELTENYTYNNNTYKVSKNSISEGATQIINWISYYTYINNKSKFNNDAYVNNMIEFVDGSMPGLNPYDEIVLMTSDFCAKKNEGSYTYKMGN